MEGDGVINLLVAHDSVDVANRLVNLLRNASYSVNSTFVESAANIPQLLDQQQWNLVLSELESETVPARELLSRIRRLELDIPTIMITSGVDHLATVEGLRMGADYVVPLDEDQYFLLAVTASMTNLEHRRKEAYWKKRYLDAESRCDQLIDSSRDAIAVVQEGTYVYVNEFYAQLFGYQGPEGMVLIPVMDGLTEASQSLLKAYLKPLSPDESLEPTTVEIRGTKPDNGDMETTVNISQVQYQGEPALQFLVPKELLSHDIQPAQSRDTASPAWSDVQPKKILDEINKAILKSARTEEQSMVLYIRVDQIHEILHSSGPLYAEQLFTIVLGNIIERNPGTKTMERFADDSIVILLDINSVQQGREIAEKLSRDIAEKTFSIGTESVALSLTICVSAINETVESAQACIQQCQRAIEQGDKGLQRMGSDHRLYVFENKGHNRIKSEKQVIEFGRLLLEKRLIGIAFQPITALQGDTAEFYEVLMRPKVEEYPESVPEDFIARVFKTPVASEIDRWVILETVKVLAEKLRQRPQTKLFINLSATTIQDTGFTAWLKVALQASNVSPTHLVFQLREIDVGRYIDQSARLIQQLAQLQGRTALTHFGLAINPLLILDKLAVNFVKIDTVIIEAARKGDAEKAVMGHLLSSLKELSPQVIVPFVENPTIIPTLWQHKVDYIQGHYIQPPAAEMNYDFVEES